MLGVVRQFVNGLVGRASLWESQLTARGPTAPLLHGSGVPRVARVDHALRQEHAPQVDAHRPVQRHLVDVALARLIVHCLFTHTDPIHYSSQPCGTLIVEQHFPIIEQTFATNN